MKARFLDIQEADAIINIDYIIGIFPVLQDAYEIRWEVCGELYAQVIDEVAQEYYWNELNGRGGII